MIEMVKVAVWAVCQGLRYCPLGEVPGPSGLFGRVAVKGPHGRLN
jgi:hypothetical protein